jgi:hypothetical protein
VLEHYDGVTLQIRHIHLLPVLLDIGVLLAHEPANVRKEEATAGIVWVSIAVRELVVNAMISHPLVYAVLECDRLPERKENSERNIGFVCTVGPQTMSTGRDSIATKNSPNEC